VSETLQLEPAEAATLAPTVDAAAAPYLGLSKRYRMMVWVPLVFVFIFGGAFWHFVSFALMSNPALNGVIFAVMAWGSYTMLGHVSGVYGEDSVFRSGLAWLRQGVGGSEQDPRFGPKAYVVGMLERLQKLGLGHQVYLHSSAMEPELEALEQYLDKRQELSQFLVGLMVGLGLLGTFIGLLETLVQTSSLIGTIAKSASGGGNMEEEFAKIVGGLQGPLTAMGTAFSASMFGLVGSIMLGFQMVVVRKAAQDFVEHVRREVLSLGEKSKVSAQVEITERFLSTLLGDILHAHKQTSTGLAQVIARLNELVPEVKVAATTAAELAIRVKSQERVLEQTSATVGGVAKVVPLMSNLATSSAAILAKATDSNEHVEQMLKFLPRQTQLLEEVQQALGRVDTLSKEVGSLRGTTGALRDEVKQQSVVVKRMDTTLWNQEKESLREALDAPAPSGKKQ
jgi:methyl-accepting chemotaxis protein